MQPISILGFKLIYYSTAHWSQFANSNNQLAELLTLEVWWLFDVLSEF